MSATPPEVPRKLTPPLLLDKKTRREKIVCLTANDYPLARILDEAGLDLLLVGDSLGMTRLGYDSTLPLTIPEVLIHLKAARRAVTRALLVADMPFGSYQVDVKTALENALVLVKEGGAEAVKLEGWSTRTSATLSAWLPRAFQSWVTSACCPSLCVSWEGIRCKEEPAPPPRRYCETLWHCSGQALSQWSWREWLRKWRARSRRLLRFPP